MKKIKIFQHVEITIPDNYAFDEQDDTIVGIYDSSINGKGALNISSYQVPNDQELDLIKEYEDFFLSGHTYKLLTPPVQEEHYVWSEYVKKNNYWKGWMFFKNHVCVFVTYNCKLRFKGMEINTIDKIVHSLTILCD